MFFFFKQKTAYEIRISDWSSDVCSSDLGRIQYIFGHRRDGTGFLGFVRVADGGADGWAPMNAGWIRRDGQFGGLDAARSRMRSFRNPKTGWSTHMQVELVDEHGRDMVSEGFVVSTMSEAGYGVNQLMRWDIEDRKSTSLNS